MTSISAGLCLLVKSLRRNLFFGMVSTGAGCGRRAVGVGCCEPSAAMGTGGAGTVDRFLPSFVMLFFLRIVLISLLM